MPQIYISKTPCAHIQFDVTLLGNCDDVVRELVRRWGGGVLVHPRLAGGRSDFGEGCAWREVERGVWEVVDAGEGTGDAEGGKDGEEV